MNVNEIKVNGAVIVTEAVSEEITFRAQFYHENEKSIAVYVIGNSTETAWRQIEWFSKKMCRFKETEKKGLINLTAPKWLLIRKGIFNDIKKI